MTNIRSTVPAMTVFITQMAERASQYATQQSVAAEDMRAWGQRFVPHFLKNESTCNLHECLIDVLGSTKHVRTQKVNVIAPRGNAKSTWIFVKVLQAICEGSEPFILYLADTTEQAARFLQGIKEELENNVELRKVYPVSTRAGSIWNKDQIITASDCCVYALGTGKKVRGLRHRQHRPTLVIGDDLENDEDVKSPTKRTGTWDWLNKALLECGSPTTNYIIIGTMLHRECIVGRLEKDPAFRTIKFQSIMKWPTRMDLWHHWQMLYLNGKRVKNEKGVVEIQSEEADRYLDLNWDEMHEGAKVLWEEHEPLIALMLKWARNLSAFMSEKQNDPRDPSKCEFKEEWFNEETGGKVWYDASELYDRLDKREQHVTVLFSDPALGGETKRHDYSPIIALHYFGDNFCYVECDIERRPVNELIDRLIQWSIGSNPSALGFEENGFQELIGDGLTARCNDPAAPHLSFPLLPDRVVPLKHFGNKNTRISRLAPWFQRRFFRFKRQDEGTALVMEQILAHPHADHDDGPDALEGALHLMEALGIQLGQTTVQVAPDGADEVFDHETVT